MNDQAGDTRPPDNRPRGIRNNNPGNVDYDPRVPWQGQLGPELHQPARFARFDTPENGIRCLCKILIAYQVYHQLWTPLDMFRRWAPENDHNNPTAYAEAVCETLNAELRPVRPYVITMPLSVQDPLVLGAMAKAVIKVENGGYEYPADTLYAGVKAASPGTH